MSKKKENKLIKDMNVDTWKKFVICCKLKDVKVSNELDEILKDYIKENLDKLLKKLKK